MLVAQPPVRELEVLSIRHGQIGDGMSRVVLSEAQGDWEGGLTMGTLYDIVCEHGSVTVGRFAVDWTCLSAASHAKGEHGVYGTLGYDRQKGLTPIWKWSVGEEVELQGGRLMLVLLMVQQCRMGSDRSAEWVREWKHPEAKDVLPDRDDGRWEPVEGTQGPWRWRGLLPN